MALTNATIWNQIRKSFPSFASHTSEVTNEFFTEQTFEALLTRDPNALNEFYELSLRVYLLGIDVSQAKDTFSESGFGESYTSELGAIAQRIAINSIKPISPAYRGLQDGDSPDPFVVRKPTSSERFFNKNFDYQSLITIQEFQLKPIFLEQYGVSNYMAGIMQGLQNGYTIQKFEAKLEVLNAMINSTQFPLKETQIYDAPLSASPTDVELRDWLLGIMNVVEAMNLPPQSNGFNALGFSSTQNTSDLYLLIRPGIYNAEKIRLLSNTYNDRYLNLDTNRIVVPHFGGLVPYSPDGADQVYPVYNPTAGFGDVIGFATTEGATTPEFSENEITYLDPNEGINAILADRRILLEIVQNPYTVEPIRNPRGIYTNYWANSPNNAIKGDPLYNMVVFRNPNITPEPAKLEVLTAGKSAKK